MVRLVISIYHINVEGGSDVSKYEIWMQGHLDQHWAAWFTGLTLTYVGGCTVLRGSLVDEAALYGVLAKVRDLHVRLLAVQVVEASESASYASASTEVGGEASTPDASRQVSQAASASPCGASRYRTRLDMKGTWKLCRHPCCAVPAHTTSRVVPSAAS